MIDGAKPDVQQDHHNEDFGQRLIKIHSESFDSGHEASWARLRRECFEDGEHRDESPNIRVQTFHSWCVMHA